MALNYFDEMVGLFQSNYSLAYPVSFDDAPPIDLSGSGLYVKQPTNDPWIRVNTDPGDTFKETIGTKATIQKDELFNLSIQVFLPRNSTGSGKVYTTNDFSIISNHLDSFLIIDSIVTTDNAVISMDQVNPKASDRSSPLPEDTFQMMVFTYRYEYRYI